jgi:exopolysaccharide biosynthesis polyprenyl glycosylphosphotransferase
MVSLLKKYPKYKWVLALFDFLIVNLSALVSVNIVKFFFPESIGSGFDFLNYISLFFLYSILILFYFQYSNLYKVQCVTNTSVHFFTLVKSSFFIVLGFIIFQFFIQDIQTISRLFYLIFFLTLTMLITFIRLPFVSLIEHSFIIYDKVVIIGAGAKGKSVSAILKNKIRFKKVVGFLDDNISSPYISGVPLLGKVEDAPEIAEKYHVDFFLLAIDNISRERFFQIFKFFQQNKLSFSVSSKYLKVLNEKLAVDIFDEHGMVRFNGHSENKLLNYVKRIIDFTASIIAVILLSPVFITIALAVKLSSRGPIIYRNIRIGKNGQPFYFYKFRSMHVNSDKDEKRKQSVVDFIKGTGGPDGSTKIVNKSRITPVGNFLRKYSLDELPQLFNVIKGDMSLVGPRPCLKNEWQVYEDWQKLRLTSTPGCTGVWQVSGRSKVNFEETVLMDIYYNQNSSPWLDIQIILKTIPVMLLGKGGE